MFTIYAKVKKQSGYTNNQSGGKKYALISGPRYKA